MRILLINDDGITAPGLWHAATALKEVGEVVVCAPDREQSGAGSALSLKNPIRVAAVPASLEGVQAFAVEGTPADCAVLALEVLVEKPVDLVVAGINEGANLGDDLFLSGTVGAALQGYFRGIPSIAVSVTSQREVRFEGASLVLQALARFVAQGSLATVGQDDNGSPARPPLLNVNVPSIPVEELEGVSVSHLSHRAYTDTVQEGEDTRGRKWYWISHRRPVQEELEGTDVWAVRHRRASITPISTGLTAFDAMPHLVGLVREMEATLKGRSRAGR